jgi:hypothetical protein
LAQVVHAVLVDVLDLRQGAVGIVVLGRGNERRQVLHGNSWTGDLSGSSLDILRHVHVGCLTCVQAQVEVLPR